MAECASSDSHAPYLLRHHPSQIETFLRGALSSPGLFTRAPDADPEAATPEKEGILEQMLISGQKVPPSQRLMLDEETFKVYLDSYASPENGGQGMEGGLNWYRTREINFEDELSKCG